MAGALLAIDQGTTSTRAIVFDAALTPLATAQIELPQIYPEPGWVEHDPGGNLGRDRRDRALGDGKAGLKAADIAGYRHHQSARNHGDLGSRHRQADPQRDRLAGPPHRRCLRAAARAKITKRRSPRRPACCSIRISPAPRSRGCSTTSRRARCGRSGQARLRHHRQLPDLAADRRPRSRHRCHQCRAHAAVRYRPRRVGRRSRQVVARADELAAGGSRLLRRVRRHRAGFIWRLRSVFWAAPATSKPPRSGRAASSRAW